MPVQLSHPGVYIQEVPSTTRTLSGVATSLTAFVGRTRRGPVGEAQRISSFTEFERAFGPLWEASPMGHAVHQYFQNGGGTALIVRATPDAALATGQLNDDSGAAVAELRAANVGAWGNGLTVSVTPGLEAGQFTLDVVEPSSSLSERHANLSTDPDSARYAPEVLLHGSQLLRMESISGAPAAARSIQPLAGGDDGSALTAQDLVPSSPSGGQGIYALDAVHAFNLLVLPPPAPGVDVNDAAWTAATAYCEDRQAVLLIDPPESWSEVSQVVAAVESGAFQSLTSPNAALYFPRIQVANPLKAGRPQSFAPSGAIAGLIASTDSARGVWKAPAGVNAGLAGAVGVDLGLTDDGSGQLNQVGVNGIRSLPGLGVVVWGARTRAGDDRRASEWKYLPVRRLALFIEESLRQGTQWAVFQPNDEALWSQLRSSVDTFMSGLFAQGAFQGTKASEAYFVRCDSTTTTQADIERGVVNVTIGFAPVKPAEFVVLYLQQTAGAQG
ncbi:MAG: phage tail sheath family protein [Alphaproteobacteria bacterium]|nr:phage tail sheath family protein [Alphaproteobacteria bacterium]MCB9794951.1 phage tail sheath family protein [Alphaproteobacteria bacterium]